MPQERERTALKEKSLYEYSVKKKCSKIQMMQLCKAERGCWWWFGLFSKVKQAKKQKGNWKKKKSKKKKKIQRKRKGGSKALVP